MNDWITAGRPGYAGHRQSQRIKLLDKQFGAGNWRIAYQWGDEVIDRSAALEHYEEAYFRFLSHNTEMLDWLCRTASEVYDIAPSNVDSGLDYSIQECSATHLQDIAVRRCLQRLGRRFEGDHLVQIRGHESEGFRLNPGQVPFHCHDRVLKPSLSRGTWWEENSVEDFWQSNKVLQVAATTPTEKLHSCLFRPLVSHEAEHPAVALFGGSFNPIHLGHLRIAQELLDRYQFARIVFVPNGNHYRKKELIDERHRAEMVRLAIAGEERFTLCEFELGRDSVIYTVETQQYLQQELQREMGTLELYNIRGSDTIPRMLRWSSLPALLECRQIVPVRPGSPPDSQLAEHPTFRLYSDRFCFQQREYEDGLSSSQVRQAVRDFGHARYLVPPAVEEYILQNGLYR